MGAALYIVSTPIGNLGDITLRATEVLKEADLIACEDTRTTKKLLARYGIDSPLTSYHEHNETEKAVELVSLMSEGKSVALVSDAGTPGISDPGYRVVKLASEAGINIVPIPGPSAAVSALSVSGLPTSSFTFLGFPPRSKKQLSEFLESVKSRPDTLIFYESPKRVVKTLESMLEALGDRDASLSREITKLHEETVRGKISELVSELSGRKEIKGEVTLIVSGSASTDEEFSDQDVDRLLLELKKDGITLKSAVEEVSGKTGYSKSKAYKRALSIWED